MSRASRAKYTGILFLSYLVVYWLIQYFVHTTEINYLTELDAAFPFMPEFVWIYHTLPLGIFMVMVIYIQKAELFMTTFWSVIVAAALMSVFHATIPAFYPREVIDVTNVHEFLVDFTRQIDQSNNTFPSAHVTFSVLMLLSVRKSIFAAANPFVARFFLLWALGISMSTLAIKQHFIADVVSGWVTALLSFYIAKLFIGHQAQVKPIYNR
jgi:membrane-associated phospholipid phosphatase